MPLHLQREADFLTKQAEKIAGLSTDNDGQAPPPQKRRSRHTLGSPTNNVILSSKFVVELIRDRYDGEDPEPFWVEFPRGDAEALEKRGVEVLAEPDERPPRKKITMVKIAEPARYSRIEFPQKRNAKGKTATDITSFSPPNREAKYHLTSKDVDWLDVYNHVCITKKWIKLSSSDFECMLSALDMKKNELTLAHLKSDISATNKTTEGTYRRHEKDYFVLQKFVAYTANTFDQLDHFNLGRSFGLTSQTAFDIWEYWKLKLQDNFYQPLVYPPANLFDYRRISLLASWNMTTVNYAQRLRHDAERIRLMYDLLQKRNHATIKVMAREEDLVSNLAELAIDHPEVKSIPADLLGLVVQYMQELSAQHPPDPTHSLDPSLEPLRDWIDTNLHHPPVDPTRPAPPAPPPVYRPLTSTTSLILLPSPELSAPARPVIFPPLVLHPAPPNHHRLFADKSKSVGAESRAQSDWKQVKQLRPRILRADLPKSLTFEHADNSCCENGPLDEDDGVVMLIGKRIKEEVSQGEEEPLYMLNNSLGDDSVVLQEIYPPLEFRTRLRSYKKTL